MKKSILLCTIILSVVFFCSNLAYSVATVDMGAQDTVENVIWANEEAYFANLYKADYNAVLGIVHSRFLGWPGTVPGPLDKEGSALFMEKLISKPTQCTFRIERKDIRVQGDVALTQYIINVNCSKTSEAKTQSSRITHTWIKEEGRWKLLGGMSCDQ